MYAVAKNSSSHIIKLLINNGADINQQNKVNGYSLFHYAAEADNVFALVYLHQKLRLDFHDVRDSEGNTPLHIACLNNSSKMMYYLLGLTD